MSVTVFSTGNYVEAEFVACALEGHGIQAFLVDDIICRINPMWALVVGGTKVIISVEDLESASDLLQDALGKEPPFEGRFFTIPLSEPSVIVAMFRWWKARRNKKSSADD